MSRMLSLIIFFTLAVVASAQPEPLVKKVKVSIHNAVDFLTRQQRGGAWDNDEANAYHGGSTALCVLALLHCDGVLDDPAIEKKRKQAIDSGLNHIRGIDSPKVYVRSLQLMALAEAREPKIDRKRIEEHVKWLLEARVYKDKRFIGWSYERRNETASSDASNTQYAMLALWYARQAGVAIERKVWEEIHEYYTRTQSKDGSWMYSPDYGPTDKEHPSVTMTIAGLCGLYIAGSEINGGREQWQKNGKAKGCGEYGDDDAIARAHLWMNGNPALKTRSKFTLELKDRTYYHLYGLERAGRLSGMRFFGPHDWYREGCEFLVKQQDANGSWPTRGGWDRWPHVNTAFALLFLSKGRTPVVMSKLVHGNWPRREDDTDWNSDRNDLRHLTEFVAKDGKLFGKRPLAWQTYDVMRALYARGNNPGVADENAVVADMRQSPILYITGHNSPLRRIQDRENGLIKRFVDNGGFLFAEACCGDPEFDKGIKEWVSENWPGHSLTYLESTHPVWSCYNVIGAGEPFKLMGLTVGCRTIMLYSPQDLSCHWESNRTSEGVSKRAFELGANIIAYGTGRVAPQPRLTPIDIASAEAPAKAPAKRGAFQVGQVYHKGDWQPAPLAMTRLLTHVHKTAGLEVALKTDRIFLNDRGSVLGAKFLYMHGREAFRFNPNDLDHLRDTLETGGLLLADACCGNEAFHKSFRQFVQALFPKEKLVTLSTDPKTRDRLFGAELNGVALTSSNISCRSKANGETQPMAPHLEGIQVNGRWVVLYSKYDLGCALEGHTSPDCLGYDQASALRIATAAVLYNARP